MTATERASKARTAPGADDQAGQHPGARPPAPIPQSPGAGRALPALYVGLGLTVLSALVVMFGDATLARHLHEVEDPWVGPAKATENRSALAAYLYVVAALGAACWLAVIRAVRRGKRWARPAAVAAFVIGTGIAVTNLVIGEYGQPILPPLLGIAGLLPSAAGLVALILLWRRGNSRNEE